MEYTNEEIQKYEEMKLFFKESSKKQKKIELNKIKMLIY